MAHPQGAFGASVQGGATHESPQPDPRGPLAEALERASILIVDDLPEKLLVFGTVLEPMEQELVFVRSGSEALREVLRREFAVILLDVNMPGMDGFETAALMRRYKRTAQTPIIFITAYADEMQTHRGYELGAVDYILSPVIPEVLRSKVQVFVDLHVAQRRVRRQAEARVALAAAEAARKVAEENTRRADLLSGVSRALASTLDLAVGMRALLERLVPALAPCAGMVTIGTPAEPPALLWCRAADDGEVIFETRPVESLVAPARGALQGALSPTADLLKTYRPVQPAASQDDLPAGTIASLSGAEGPLGALFVAGVLDEPLLVEVAGRAAMSFDNARLYRSLQGEIVERRAAEKRLMQSNQRKDEFLAMLSHELRNPLAPIRSAVEVIRRIAPPDPKLAWATDVTDRQVTHLTRLVEELLDVARINQGKIALQMEAIDLQAVIAHSVETARPGIDARGHRLVLQVPSAPVWMRGDFPRLSQVVGNLLNNAAKYTQDGGVIQLSMQVDEGQAVISVRDNGIGIDEEMLPNVFELFEQGKRSLDRSQGGLGVGLTLARRLVQLHQGRVEAHSAGVGQGAEFVVRLPCLSQVAVAAPAPAQPREAVSTVCRVLVVDDNRDAADTVAMVLRMDGHSVETAGDGPQALASAVAYAPDVVVLDIGLPGLDGYEVARRLRQTPHGRAALLIALTGYGQASDAAQALASGFDRHLVKPADPAELSNLIAQWRGAEGRSAAVAPAASSGAAPSSGG